MAEKLDGARQIGRRIRLRDLHILLAVGERGSMAGAAAQLGVSQPAVSGTIADLERTLGVPLFERSTRGVTPTVYARAMMDRSTAAFDELRQGIRTIESLADPAAGELWIGCIESLAVLALPPLVDSFMQRYPRVAVHVMRLAAPIPQYRDLCERNLDLALGRMPAAGGDVDGLRFEPLVDDRLMILAGARTRWARRRKLELGELADERWILTQPDCWTYGAILQAHRARGLAAPRVCLTSQSISLRFRLAATGRYVTVVAGTERSVREMGRGVEILPIDLPECLSPLSVVTLKDRVLNPVAQSFIDHLRSRAAPQRQMPV